MYMPALNLPICGAKPDILHAHGMVHHQLWFLRPGRLACLPASPDCLGSHWTVSIEGSTQQGNTLPELA